MPFVVRADELVRGFSRQVRQARRFYLEFRTKRRAPLLVVRGGWELCTADYAFDSQEFGDFAVELVVTGKLSAELAGKHYALGPGAVFSYGPGIGPRLRADPEEPPLKYFVHFIGARAHSRLERARLPPGAVRQLPSAPMLRELLDAMISAAIRRTPRTAAICASLLDALLLTVGDSAVAYAPAEARSYATYRRCREWLEARGREATTVAEVARRCHLDPAYLCRLFRRYDRETPYQMMQRLRMQRAAALLQQPGAMVKTVALDLGFSDPFHFSRAFKRHFGVAPAQVAKRVA